MPRSSSSDPRLRARRLSVPLHIVLVEPEIPPNTGNVARLSAAAGSPLHLVGPLGFRIDEHSVRRAGVDYWHLVDVRQHIDFESFLGAFTKESPAGRLHLFSAGATRSYLDAAPPPRATLASSAEAWACPMSSWLASRTASSAFPRWALCRSTSTSPGRRWGSALYEALRKLGALADTFVG